MNPTLSNAGTRRSALALIRTAPIKREPVDENMILNGRGVI